MDDCFLHLLLPLVLLRFGVRKRFTPTAQVKVVVSLRNSQLGYCVWMFHKHTRLFPNRKHNATIAVYPPYSRLLSKSCLVMSHAWYLPAVSAESILFMPNHLKCLDLLERKCICSEGKCFTQFQTIPHAVSAERARFQSLNARVKEPLLPRSFLLVQHLSNFLNSKDVRLWLTVLLVVWQANWYMTGLFQDARK